MKLNSTKGFTLIELILYIALVSIFVTGAVRFAWDISYGREKAYQTQLVSSSGRNALSRITYEIRRARDVQSVSAGQIVLDNGGSTTTISLISGGVVQLTTGGMGPYALTSDQVYVDSLLFTNLQSSDKNSKAIGISMNIRQAQSGVPGQFAATTSIHESVELNSLFNASRAFLVDASVIALSANKKQVTGLSIINIGSSAITLDKMKISWVGTGGGENIVGIQIDGGIVEWTGVQPSGALIDITNVMLFPDTPITVDYIEFGTGVSNATFDIAWIFTDGSTSRSLMSFTQTTPTPTPTIGPTPTPTTGPTPTPTSGPTPTPTPVITTCLGFCQSLGGYTAATCRPNAIQCTNNGQTHVAGGDIYCTGGANADTCCCN